MFVLERLNNSKHKLISVSLIFCLFVAFTTTEINYSASPSVFLVQEYNFTPQKAALILSVYFVVNVTFRASGIFPIQKLKPKTLLCAAITLSAVANILLYFAHLSHIIIWTSICLSPIAIATQFPTVVAWSTQFIQLTGWAGITCCPK